MPYKSYSKNTVSIYTLTDWRQLILRGTDAYAINQPVIAEKLLNDKLQAMKDQDMAFLATSNIARSFVVTQGLRDKNIDEHLLDPIQIIAQQIGHATKN